MADFTRIRLETGGLREGSIAGLGRDHAGVVGLEKIDGCVESW